MSTALLTPRLGLNSVADKALKTSARFWFVVVVIGQSLLAFTVASFYGLTAVRGDWQAWNKFMLHGYIAGRSLGNFAVALHVLSAAIVLLAGVIQLIPQVRNRFPAFHRWNGRIYMLTAFTLSLAGLYLHWFGESVGDLSVHLAGSLNALLIMLYAVIALRYAVARDFRTHRRWALRLFLVVSASWFFRVAFFLTLAVFKGPIGFDPKTFSGPFLTFMSFAQYLVPLAILELYLRARDRPGAPRRIAMAAGLVVLTVVMGAGIVAVTMGVWVRQVRAAYDNRKSIDETLSSTITSRGIGAAVQQYHDLKAAVPATYNFDENELNNLGYQLIRDQKFKEAIRVFQLNIEAYPQSSNVYDSLGEAYLDDGNNPLAIANYRKSLQLNPHNRNAVETLQKLGAP